MDTLRPSRFSIFVFYIFLLLMAQTVLFISLPKDVYRGCRPPSMPSTEPTEQIKSEIIYCLPSENGFEIITGNEYSAAYKESDACAPAVIAQFIWIDHGTTFSRYSLWHMSDRSRKLQFYARCGEHGQTHWTTNEHELRSSISRETGNWRYSMGAYNSVTIPVFTVPMVTAKLIANGLLILLARKTAVLYQYHVAPRVRRVTRRDPNTCIWCGYDCVDLPTSICPECGHNHAQPQSA